MHDEAGKAESVRYSMLTSMLLNEVQKQRASLIDQKKTNERQAKRVDRLTAQMTEDKAATQRADSPK